MKIRSRNAQQQHRMVEVVNSNRLEIHKVTNFVFGGDCIGMFQVRREDMGAYLCIASNDVPPAVSKRVYLMVQCEFSILDPTRAGNVEYIRS